MRSVVSLVHALALVTLPSSAQDLQRPPDARVILLLVREGKFSLDAPR